MSAKSKVADPVAPVLTVTENLEDTAPSAAHHDADQPSSDTGARKRPRESGSSPESSRSHPQSSSTQNQVTPDERARKKSRIDRESELESLMIEICLERIDRRRIDLGQAQLTNSATDMMTGDLKNIFRKLKGVDTEDYAAHSQHLDTACNMLADVKARSGDLSSSKERHNTELDKAKQEVEKTVLDFFDRDSLLKICALLRGNGRWQGVLRSLGLPLTGLRNLDSNLRFQREKNDIERQLKSEVTDLLAWLTPHELNPSVPVLPSYNDTSTRNNDITVMKTRLNEQTALQEEDIATLQAHGGRADHLRSVQSQITSLSDGSQQQQPPPSGSVVQYVLRDAHFKELLAQKLPASNVVAIYPKPDRQCPEPSEATEGHPKQQNDEPPASTTTKTTDHETQWELTQDAAMVLARSIPQQKADARAEHELKQKVAAYSKLQTFGQAYKIIIEQLKSAQNGGTVPTLVDDLQMPDAEACYYRLESLWNRVLQAINDRGVEHLRANIDLFYTFAICMREAHCLLRVLHYYGYDVSQLVETGWDLDGMRRLQSELVDFAHEEPFIWSKPDVDAICTALQAAHNEHALSTGSQPPRFAAVAKPSQEPVIPTDTKHHLDQVLQQPSIAQPVYYPQHIPVAVPSAQPPIGYTNYQAPTANFLPNHVGAAGHEAMDVDQTPQICSFFRDRGGCTKVGDARRPCNFDHPESMKYDAACPNLMKSSRCQFGDLGCRFRHDVFGGVHGSPPNVPQPQAQPVPNAGAAVLANTLVAIGTAPNGKKRDPGLGSSYCRGNQQGNCRKGDRCSWLHDIPPPGLLYQNVAQVPAGPLNPQSSFTTDNPFQTGMHKVQSVAQQGPEAKGPCQYLAKGSCRYPDHLCKYSHDPVVFENYGTVLPQPAQQPLGDATMGGAASNGDNTGRTNTGQRSRSKMPCRNENNGRHCSKPTCWFMHTNPESAAYVDANGYSAGDEMDQPQHPPNYSQQTNRSGRGGRGAQNDFTYQPQQPLTFEQLPQTQNAADARARLEQFLLNSATQNVQQPLQGNQRGGIYPNNRPRGNGGRASNKRGNNGGNQNSGNQGQGNWHSLNNHTNNGSNHRGGHRGGRGNQMTNHNRGGVQVDGPSNSSGGMQVAYAQSTGSGGL